MGTQCLLQGFYLFFFLVLHTFLCVYLHTQINGEEIGENKTTVEYIYSLTSYRDAFLCATKHLETL